MNDYYDMGDDYSGDWGNNYGDASGPEYTDYDFGDSSGGGDWGFDYSGDYGDSGGTFDPDAYLASQGGYTPPSEPGLWDQLQGMPAQMGSAFMKNLQSNPMGVLAQLGGLGSSLYSTIQGQKQRDAQAREMKDVRDKRAATLAKYGAVLPMKMDRSMLPQGDLLRAGERSGGTNWFTPTTFRNMADGGQVKQGWLDALLSRKPSPAVVGSGAAARAGDAMQDRNYRLYLQMQEMDGAPPLPYEVWARSQRPDMAEGGALSGMVEGPGGGQDDLVPINAADGEYVIDAASVSDIGDGSNEEGARRLDEMLQRLRAHRRSAPVDSIPPRAKSPEQYLEGEQ